MKKIFIKSFGDKNTLILQSAICILSLPPFSPEMTVFLGALIFFSPSPHVSVCINLETDHFSPKRRFVEAYPLKTVPKNPAFQNAFFPSDEIGDDDVTCAGQ